ncbi:MAG TPA: DUF5666 domain-containing protein [Ktedonobacteraceae bacterium]|nr:DUF5666 domain-containing protein [Ktedonobacteraceae bacterium]
MRLRQLLQATPKGFFLFIFLGLFLIAGCGSNSTSTSSTSANATATACAQATRPATAVRTAIGTLQSINGQTLSLKNQQGKTVTVTYSSSTRFSQETTIPPSSLTEGTTVRVAVTSSGSTYTATNITVTTGTTSTGGGFGGGFPRANRTPGAGLGGRSNPCFRNRFATGTPGTGSGTGSTFRGISGKVSQLNGDILTVTDSTGAAYTVTVTSQTQIVETKSATAAALKVGQPLTVTGTAGSNGAIKANAIIILLSLPARNATSPTS